MEPSGRLRSALLTGLGVLVALGVVGIATRGATPVGEGGSASPSGALTDIAFTLYIVALVAGGVLFLYLLVLHRHARRTGPGGPAQMIRNLASLLVFMLVVGLVVRGIQGRGGDLQIELPAAPPPPEGADPGGSARQEERTFAWIPVLVTLGLLAAAVLGVWWSERARRAARGERRRPRLAEELVAALDESLDDLRAEPDPRRAVIAAYARLERVLAGRGLPRSPAEAPLEYLARVLTELSVGARAASRLTDLFERAKFSQHAVGPEMKDEAIDALETVRDDLLAARERAERERQAALEARQRAAAG
jgi:hypothetical protein